MTCFPHVIGIDDAPFTPTQRASVWVIGAVFSQLRLEGVLSSRVRRDGADATRVLGKMISGSRFASHIQVVLLQGIALGGFNVIDLPGLQQALGVPVVAVARRSPDRAAIRQALLTRVRGGRRKWALIEQLGPMEAVAGVFVQRVGISLEDTERLIRRLAVNSVLPEPLRTAHLIGGGLVLGESRHRA